MLAKQMRTLYLLAPLTKMTISDNRGVLGRNHCYALATLEINPQVLKLQLYKPMSARFVLLFMNKNAAECCLIAIRTQILYSVMST